jgi:hypothetical protein
MPRNFNFNFLPKLGWPPRNSADIAQLLLVVALVLNLVAGWFVWRPLGGSPAELERQMIDLRGQVLQRRLLLERTRQNVAKVETGRSEGDNFLQTYFLGERTAYSSVVGELLQAARDAKIKPKEHSFALEPIEGSDDLAKKTITGSYEGTYADLIAFINRLDRSTRLLIVESLNATPQQGGAGVLNVSMKLDAFVRQEPRQEVVGQ